MTAELSRSQPACVQDDGSWCARIYRLTGNDLLARYADAVLGTGIHILLILVLAVLTWVVLHRAIRRSLSRSLRPRPTSDPDDQQATAAQDDRRAARARAVGSVLHSASTLVVSGVAIIMVLGELGVSLSPILASVGILGLALGFGAQNLVRDFLSGMFMLAEDQYDVGDRIDLGEATGIVEAVGMRITTVRDENGTLWHVRNGEVQRVGNASQGYSVAVIDLPIGSGANLPKVIDIAGRAAADLTAEGTALAEDVLEPPQVLGIESLDPGGVTLRVTVKVRAGQHLRVQRALLTGIRDAFAAAGVPPPSRLIELPAPPS